MILCGKCNKKPDSVTEKMCVIHYRYDVTVKCHGETEMKPLTRKQLDDAEATDLLFFAPSAPAKREKKLAQGHDTVRARAGSPKTGP